MNSRFVRGQTNAFNDEEHYGKRASSEARAILDHDEILEETRSFINQMRGDRKPAYSKKLPGKSVFKTPDNGREVLRTSASNLRD
jgi:hypothetical protein